jgi:hypothetical protein
MRSTNAKTGTKLTNLLTISAPTATRSRIVEPRTLQRARVSEA